MHEHSPTEEATDHRHAFESPEVAVAIELEGEVLEGLVTEATSVLAELCRQQSVEVRRVVDVGCGPGVGTCSLAQGFPSASVVGADGSAAMLERVTARAERLVSPRVKACLVQLPEGLGTLGRADVVWASMVLHHVGDEVAALRQFGGLLERGGRLALVEGAGPVRALPEGLELGRPGLWERLDAAWAAWFADMRATLPGSVPSGDYPAMLEEAGLELVADQVLTVVIDGPLDDRARRFGHGQLRGIRGKLGPYAEAADLAALDALIDEQADAGFMRRADARISASRHLFVAQAASER